MSAERVCRQGSFEECGARATHVLFQFDRMAGARPTAEDVCAKCGAETIDWCGGHGELAPSPFRAKAPTT